MRFVSRILIGVAAATAMAVSAPLAATAAPASTSTSSSSSSHFYEADWGPYYSSDHKASAEGHVTVDKQAYKFWYWKTFFVKKKVCWVDKHGNKHCKIVIKKIKKHVWVWKYNYFYSVDSTLTNYKWWGHNRCAWESFKVVNYDGSSYFKSFYNCFKHPQDYSFSGKNAKHIWVDVSRGNKFHPTGYHSGWMDVYHAA